MAGDLLSHKTGQRIGAEAVKALGASQSEGGSNGGNGEPPDGRGRELHDRVRALEVEQSHSASKADVEGLKSWLSEKLEGQQRWFTERIEAQQKWSSERLNQFGKRLDRLHWWMIGLLASILLAILVAGFRLAPEILRAIQSTGQRTPEPNSIESVARFLGA